MILTRESRRTWWLVILGAWALAALLVTRHTLAMRDYVALLDNAAPRNPPISTPHRHIIPTNYADTQTWVRYALTFDEGAPWRVRYTHNDNAPAGRAVHWNTAFAHLIAESGRIRHKLTGEPLPLATERIIPWLNLPLLLVVVVGFSSLVGRYAGAGAGALVALGIVGTESFYSGFAPSYVDHHGLLTSATFGLVLGAIFMGGGWWRAAVPDQPSLLPSSLDAARRAAIFSAVCGAVGLWFSAASTIPAIALTGLAGLVAAWIFGRAAQRDGAAFEADLWRLWGRVGAATAFAFYLFEYAPTHLGLRLEVNHPFYALAWWGGAELVALLAERRLAAPDTSARPLWRWLAPLVAISAAPLTIVLGGVNVFVVSDPFVSEIPKTVAEGLSLVATTQAFGWQTLFHYINWNIVPLIVAAALLFFRPQRDKHLLLFAFIIALGFLGLLIAQIRWSFGASGPFLCLLLVVLAALVQARRPLIRWLAAVAVAAVCFVPDALQRTRLVQSSVAARSPDRMDIQQLLYRDAAAFIRASQPAGDIVLLASPNGSSGMGYYGKFRTIGTLYWENYAGMRAAAEIFCAPTADRARELIRAHGITHLAMISEESFLAQFFTILRPNGTREEFQKTFGYQVLSDQVLPPWLRPIPYRAPPDVVLPDLRVLLLQVVPDQSDSDALWHIALAQLALGDATHATQSFENAVRAAPADKRVQLCQSAAATCYQKGAHTAAVRLFRAALTAGENPVAAGNLAWVLATSRDDAVRNGAEALALAERLPAGELTTLSALAAAQAETGRFPDAVATLTRAIELIRRERNTPGEAQFLARLEAYRAGQPWRQ
jgi:tetratricopeptide (TPR) repeat protein